MDTLDRLISVIIYADIVGYSSMMQEDEQHALLKLKHFEEVIKLQSKKYDGEIVKAYGDGCLMLFSSAVSAIKCSISIQKNLREEPYVPLRIGIHVGEIVRKDHDIFGDGLNIASRIESMGVANSVLISSDIYFQIKNHPEFITVKIGDFTFKNIERDITLYAISNDDLTVPLVKDMGGKGKMSSSSSVLSNKKIRFLWILVILILGSLVIYNISDLNFKKSKTGPSGGTEKSMAVLPLININQKDDLEYFSDGVTQEIIDELAKIKTFRVTAFTSTFPYKKKGMSPLEIANELNVNYLISGSARIYGDSIKLSIELINPYSKEERVWSQTYNEVIDNAPAIQLLIAKQVAKSLDIKLTVTEKKSLEKVNTKDGEAFNLFLKAKAENLKLTPAGFNEATQYLERAIELDPNYSQAYTLLAFNHNLDGQAFFNAKIGTSELLSLVSPLINKSISLNPKSSDIYLVRANLNLFAKGQLRDAKKDVEHALELNSWPRIPTNYCICTVVSTYVALGDLNKAKELANLGREVDPGNVFIYFDQANIHMLEGQVKKAQALFEEGLKNLDIPFFHFFLGWSYYHDQQFTEALKHFEKAYENDIVPLHMNVAYLSNSHFKIGNKVESERYLQVLKKRMESGDHHVNLAMAMISAAQSDIDETLSWLEKSQEKRENILAYMVNVDPIFKPLYKEPRFKEIRTKMQYYE